jgi:hypothetical protein
LKAPHSKCGILARVSGVRIPPSPPRAKFSATISRAQISRIQSRIASRGHRAPGGCQTCEDTASARDVALTTLCCVPVTPADNIVRQRSTSFGKLVLVPFEAVEHVVSEYHYTGALFLQLLAASYRSCPALLRLSSVEMGGRNQDGNGEKRRHRRDGAKADSLSQHFLLQNSSMVRKG